MVAIRPSVKVIHGANDGIFDLAGSSVANVQTALADAFNIPIEAFAYVNGKVVGEEFRLRGGESVEFLLPWGMKGAKPKLDGSRLPPIKTAFPYIGGKAKVASEIWRRFGDVKNYVEPFFGGGAVLLNRPLMGPNRFETVNDIDSLLVNFWRAVKLHPHKLAIAADYPVSELDLHARQTWLVQKRDVIAERIREQEAWCDTRIAAWWVWGASQWIGKEWCPFNKADCEISHQRPSLERSGVHRIGIVSNGNSLREYFSLLSARLERVRILSGDWSRAVTPATTTRFGMTGVLLDPPYTAEAGRGHRLYAHDDLKVGHQVRDWAVMNGENPLFRIALCGYEGEYRMPSSWSVFEWKSGGSRNGHKERIWFSPHCLA